MIARYDYASAPRELLPWADPYIAQLVARLQREDVPQNDRLSQGRDRSAGRSIHPPRLLGESALDWPESHFLPEFEGGEGFDTCA